MRKGVFLLGTCAMIALSACGVPYTLYPQYHELAGGIRTVGLYPLQYEQDGREQRLFGVTFAASFYDQVRLTECSVPMTFLLPDSTMQIFASTGAGLVSSVRGVVDKSDLITEYPVYLDPQPQQLHAVSDRLDAIVYVRMVKYNEVGAAGAWAQSIGTACLTGGMASTSEQNALSLTMTMVHTGTGALLWQYKGAFSEASMFSGREEVRARFVAQAVRGFARNFPLSARFAAKR